MPEAREPAGPRTELDRLGLRADCARCFALCCVAPAFSASADFAITKAAGQPCPHLRPDFRCGVHQQLRQRGFRGCAVYDCLGAGQKVSQVTFGGQDWRGATASGQPGAPLMFGVFAIMRSLHELLWYLAHARSQPDQRHLPDAVPGRCGQGRRLHRAAARAQPASALGGTTRSALSQAPAGVACGLGLADLASHARRQLGGQLPDLLDALRGIGGGEQPVHEGRAHDDTVGEPGYLGRLRRGADPEPDRYRQLGVLPDPGYQLLRRPADPGPGAGDAHYRGGVDESAARGGDQLDPLVR